MTVADRSTTQKAGVDGLLLSVSRTDRAAAGPGTTQVEVDYSTFERAYGGDWASRLRLVQLPSCAMTTPEKAQCQIGRPLTTTTNNSQAGTLTAIVDVPVSPSSSLRTPAALTAMASGAMVLAATAGNSGPTGDYKATSLQSSGSWTAGSATGAFSWSYPIGVPAVPGGPKPSLSLAYNSQSVDGRTAVSNSQPSWAGDGWSLDPGFIERRYKPCNDDKTGGTNTTKVGDLCWFSDNATMSLGGKSTELVYDKDKGWHPAKDSGEKVEKLTGASNGDNDGEHWKVTTTDGTQYFFGLNHLPGWKDSSTPATNSTWTVPVFGNQAGEPCYKASFASAWCQQAWRWQLDYVVDVHNNAMAYYWNTETNNYGRDVSESTGKATPTPYVRGGWLDHIDYGLRTDSVYSANAMGRVKFDVSERCLTTCDTFDDTTKANWPDTPFDLYCKDGATECKDQTAPTFWSRKRLTSITTKALVGGVYKDVDSWSLKQGFPASGDGISTPMWLESITRTGKAGGTASLPPVTFASVQLPNRVDKLGDGLAPFVRLRLSQITTESGGTIAVNYSAPDCTASSLPPADGSNTTRCYPVKWEYEGDTAKQDWFNSYVTTQVFEGDNLADTPDKVTSYSYLGGAAWAKSADEFTKPEDRSYSVARGYERVQTRTGAANDPKTLSETRYFRGLDGKDVADSAGVAVTDRDQFAGMQRETATYNGDDTSKLISATSYTPWRSTATATRPRAGLSDLESHMTGTEKESTRTTISSGTRVTELTRHYDSYGMVDWTSEAGDTSKAGDEKCTTTSYARNTNSWLLNKVSRTETVAVACDSTASRPADVLSDTQMYYDNGALGAAPTKGDLTKTGKLNGQGDGSDTVSSTPSLCGLAKNQLCYDIYGRPLAMADAYGKVTTTTYTPAVGEATSSSTVTNPLGHIATTVFDPLRAQPTQVTDANGKVSTTVYDPLGRVSKVWLPTRSATIYPDSPNYAFDYLIRNDGANIVTSRSLNQDSEYKTSYTFYDGLLRPRETQERSPDLTGRLVTETFYDTRGLAWRSSGTFYTDGAAEPVLVTGQELKYPASTDTVYDGAGRTTAVISKKFGEETKRTATTYSGDTTTVVPPAGGTATTTVVDALGRTTELKEYTDVARTSSQSTLYSYNKQGLLQQLTDPSGAQWTHTYDSRGRETEVNDPDKGVSKTSYDQGDRPTDTTDARGITLHTDYDALGRRTSLKQGSTVLASWEYDATAKGYPSKSTEYVGGKAYESAITTYNGLYQPVNTQVTIPDSEGSLAGTYKWTTSYNPNSGQVMWTKQPAIGGLPAETVTTKYTRGSGLLALMGTGTDALVADVTYDHYGRNQIEKYGALGQGVSVSNTYDEHTGALTDTYLDKDTAPQRIEDSHYTYDQAGNITALSTSLGQDAARTTDTQCVNLDALKRITDAWTSTSNTCTAAPSSSVVGGQDAYWTSYTYDAIGNRKSETQHTTASGPASDTTRAYTSPPAGSHALPKVIQTGANAHDETYSYDKSGNTQTRTIGSVTQSLAWDQQGRLQSVTQDTSTTNYLYDAEGQRLIRRDSAGTTLYLPNGNELLLNKAGAITGTRYYTAGGKTIAMRTGGKLAFLFSDHHGTGTTQVTADATQVVSRRKSTLFGAPRGNQPGGWNGDKGFVGGTMDRDTGLTHLGAREYDPALGRFISADPLLALDDAQSLNSYTYSNNNPITSSDPSGQDHISCIQGVTCGEQENFIESYQAPDVFSGETWESTYSDFPKTNKPVLSYTPLPRPLFSLGNGTLSDYVHAETVPLGIVEDPEHGNQWETSRALFLGWLWGGGFPLSAKQTFRGGDAFTAVLASDDTISSIRYMLSAEAASKGMSSSYAKKAYQFSFQDKGPEPNSPWYKANSIRGAITDLAGVLTNGKVGTSNYADAFLGSYSGTAQIKSVDPRNGVARVQFTAHNLSDWNSATHKIPRSWNPLFEGTFGQKVEENFSWQEDIPLDCRVP
ncbi:RHS repeat-associated core domain-containing protein [Streptomyces sp. NPDC052000]|uniref:RHS repeat domain-containing protein n=1 Tax=Streptomyces sp. NPDC052000 TaxID=3155676 RepID=UPI00344D8F3B